MSKHTKLLLLEIDYELSETESKDLESTSLLTRNLINNAYQENNPRMGEKIAKQWRSVRKMLEEAIEKKLGYVIFSPADSDSVYEQVYKAEYVAAQARLSPYLLDELDITKHRSPEEEEKVQKEMTALKEAVDDSKKEPLSDPEKKAVDEKLKEIIAANK